jgi:DNA-binding response OmpR family regulator
MVKTPKSDNLTVGGVELNDREKIVTVDDESVSLTPIEYAILKLLMENPNKVYSSKDIYRIVWNEEPMGNEGAVSVHIRHLREKIEIDPGNPRYIKVVWGQGYKMEGGKK